MTTEKAFNVLVLCTGNICRSPVGEAILSSLCSDVEAIRITSAGLRAPTGVKPDDKAVASARVHGFELDGGKRSKDVGILEIMGADLVLVMELSHKKTVLQRVPSVNGRVFLFGQWTVGEIEDPIGREIEVFNEVARKLVIAAKSWEVRIRALHEAA